MGKPGYITEVFGSFQGEGPFVGERHVFVRFAGCGLGCEYCDTPGSAERPPSAMLEDGPGEGGTVVQNPLTADTVAVAVLVQEPFPGFNAKLSVTGGEPLEQPEFLRELLGLLDGWFPVMLETNGLHARAFTSVAGLVDIVSMDIKLPSVSGLGPLWEGHADFLAACGGKELVVKTVVSADTGPEEVARAAGLVASLAPDALFVIQPLTEASGLPATDGTLLSALYRAAKGAAGRVRVIPQVHRILGVR